MNPQSHIRKAHDAIKAMKGAVGVDPKWLNKVLARLEEVEVFAEKIIRPGSLAATPEANQTLECICPIGAIDISCPARFTSDHM